MNPIFIGIGLVVGLGALAWLSSEENEARSDYEHGCRQLEKETKQRANNIQKLQRENKQAEVFYRHLALYRASVQSSSTAFSLYDKHKRLMNTIYHKIKYFGQRIGELKTLRDNSYGKQRQQYRQELALMHLYLSEAKNELMLLKSKKEVLLSNLQEINHQTHTLKVYIAENCGEQGRKWYARLEQRKNT